MDPRIREIPNFLLNLIPDKQMARLAGLYRTAKLTLSNSSDYALTFILGSLFQQPYNYNPLLL